MLDRQALPPEASEEDWVRAVHFLSGSVTRRTQDNYACAVRHYQRAEVVLGRSFPVPPFPTDIIFLTGYLLGKQLEPNTCERLSIGHKEILILWTHKHFF